MDDIKQLVQSIQKHTNFKRLAAYSISSLCKKCTPPSNGWQEYARTAFEAGAARVLGTILQKNATDAELMLLCLTQLQATAAAGQARELVESGVLTDAHAAFEAFLADAHVPAAQEIVRAGQIVAGAYAANGPHAEKVAVIESCLRLLLFVAAQARAEAAAPTTGIIPVLVRHVAELPTPSALRLGMQTLEALSRHEAGLAQLLGEDALRSVIAATAVIFMDDASAARPTSVAVPESRTDRVAAAIARRNVLSPSAMPGARGGSAPMAQAGGIAKLHVHLDAAFRLLDRVSRDARGLTALRACKAVPQLAPAVECARVACGPATGELAVRVLARVLGSDIAALIDKVEGVTRGEVALSEGEFAASLLASLALDGSIATKLINGGLIPRMAALLDVDGGKASSAGIAASIAQALARVALHSSDGLAAVLTANAVTRIMRCVRLHPDSQQLLVLGLTAVSDLISDQEHIEAVDAPPPGLPPTADRSGVSFIVRVLATHGASDAPVAAACVFALYALLLMGYDVPAMHAHGVVKPIVAAMTAAGAGENSDLQVIGSLLLHTLAVDAAYVDSTVAAGGIVACVANMNHGNVVVSGDTGFSAASRLSFDGAAGASAGVRMSMLVSRDGGVDDAAGAAAAPSGASYRTTAAMRAAAALTLMTTLCSHASAHVAAAKSHGVIRAMLGAFTRHRDNDAVFMAFLDLVNTIIYEDEVHAAVKAVARGTAALKGLVGDPALFGIVEQELGSEGVLDAPTTSAPRSAAGTAASTLAGVATSLAEDLCLLEAVAMAARLARVLVAAMGISMVTRCMGFISIIKAVPRAGAAGPGGAGGSRVAALAAAGLRGGGDTSTSLSEAMQEEILVRCSNALTNLARLQINSAVGVPGMDPVPTSAVPATDGFSSSLKAGGQLYRGGARASASYGRSAWLERWLLRVGLGDVSGSGMRRMRLESEAVDVLAALHTDVAAALYRPVIIRAVIRALNAKTTLKAHVAAASIAVGVIAYGVPTAGTAMPPVELVVNNSGVEAVTGILRTHTAILDIVSAAANALGCISAAGRPADDVSGLLKMPAPAETAGTAAVGTRGATRQLIRELQTAAVPTSGAPGAKWRGPAGAAALGNILRALLCVADTSKGAELLRKQGTVDALVSTLDAGAAEANGTAASAGAPEASSSAPAASAGGGDDATSKAAVASALQGDAFAGLGLEGDGAGGDDSGGVSEEANALIIAILSKLMDNKDLREALRLIRSSAEKAAVGTLKAAAVTLCNVALTTVLAICEGAQADKIEPGLWQEAMDACSSLAGALFSSATAAEAAHGPDAAARQQVAGRAIEVLLPGTLQALDALSRSRFAEGDPAWIAAGKRAADLCCAMLDRTCGDAAADVPDADSRIQRTLAAMPGAALHLLRSVAQRSGAVSLHFIRSLTDPSTVSASAQTLMARGSYDLVGVAMDVFRAAITNAPTLDTITAVLRAEPSIAMLLCRGLPDMLSSNASAMSVHSCMALLAALCEGAPAIAQNARELGFASVVKQCLQRYCDVAGNGTAAGMDAEAVGMLASCASLMTSLAGRCGGAAGDAEASARVDAELSARIVSLVAADATCSYLSSCTTMTAVCNLVATVCTPIPVPAGAPPSAKVNITTETADTARGSILEVGGRSVVVAAMSNTAADADLVKAGARAMAALGGGAAGAAADVRKAVALVRKLLQLPAVSGMLPSGDIASVGESGGTPSHAGKADASNGELATPLAVGTALRDLESSNRNLAAVVGGEPHLTATAVRYVYDTFVYAMQAAATIEQLAGASQLSARMASSSFGGPAADTPAGAARPRPARAPSNALSSSTSMGSTPTSDKGLARMRTGSTLPASRLRSPSMAARGVGPARKASMMPAGGSLDDALDDVLSDAGNSEEALAMCCSTIIVSSAQGLGRLVDVPQQLNRRAGVAVGSSTVTAWDMTPDEKLKYGDPKDTASGSFVAKQYASSGKVLSPASTSSRPTLLPPISAHELADFVYVCMGLPGGGASVELSNDRVEATMRAMDAIVVGSARASLWCTSRSSGSGGTPASADALTPIDSPASAAASPLSIASAPSPLTSPALMSDASAGAAQVCAWAWALVARGVLPVCSDILHATATADASLSSALPVRIPRAARPLLHASMSKLLTIAQTAGVPATLRDALSVADSSTLPYACPAIGSAGNVSVPTVLWSLLTAVEVASRPSPNTVSTVATQAASEVESGDCYMVSQHMIASLANIANPGASAVSEAAVMLCGGDASPAWTLLSHASAQAAAFTSVAALPSLRVVHGILHAVLTKAVGDARDDDAVPHLPHSDVLCDLLTIAGTPPRVSVLLSLLEPLSAHVLSHAEEDSAPAGSGTGGAVADTGATPQGGIGPASTRSTGTVVERASDAAEDDITPLMSTASRPRSTRTPAVARTLSRTASLPTDPQEELTRKATDTLRRALLQAALDRAMRVLSHTNVDATEASPRGGSSALTVRAQAEQLVQAPALSLYRGALRQRKCDVLATNSIQTLRRVSGLNVPGAPPFAMDKHRVKELAAAGVFSRVMLAMALHSDALEYVREAIRLLRDVGMAVAHDAGASALAGTHLTSLGLDEACMKTLQAAVKRHGEDGGDEYVQVAGDELLEALSEVYANVSGKGFLLALARALTAMEACPFVRKAITAGSEKSVMYFDRAAAGAPASGTVSTPGGSRSGSTDAAPPSTSSATAAARGLKEQPAEFTKMLDALDELLSVCDNLDSDAVPVVSPDLLQRTSDALQSYRQDARVAGIVARALTRSADHAVNIATLGAPGIIDAVTTLTRYHRTDAFVSEAVVAFFRPLSVHADCVQVMKDKNVVPALCALAEEHRTTMLPARKRGGGNRDSTSGGSDKNDASVLSSLMSPAAGDAAAGAEGGASASAVGSNAATVPGGGKAFEPLIVHYAVQVLANIACDQGMDDESGIPNFKEWEAHIGEGCPGGVARVVAAGGVDILREAMNSHLQRPRVLEDALCAMSNIAYSTDGIRLLIGRTSAGIIVQVLKVFNNDAYLFSMALRAVGNLTRCDENIVSVVGFGVSDGIVEGMRHNSEDAGVLRLAADVIGNLASLDEEAIDRKEGLRALKAGIRRRTKDAQTRAKVAGTATPPTPADVASPAVDISSSLQDAVAGWLLDDGAHEGLCTAMVDHHTDSELVSACLRSLQYLAEAREHVERMQSSCDLAQSTVFVMRSCDFDAELCVRGSLLLAQMLRHAGSPAKTAALEAGAAQVLMSVLQTHRHDSELVSNVLRILLLLGPDEPAFIEAAAQTRGYDTLVQIAAECVKVVAPHVAASAAGVDAAGAPVVSRVAAMSASSAASAGEDEDAEEAASLQSRDDSRPRLSGVTKEEATVMLRQSLSILASWSSDANLAHDMSSRVCRAIVALLTSGDGALASDVIVAEACACILAEMVTSDPTTASALLSAGVMQVLKLVPQRVELLDREPIVRYALTVMTAIGTTSAATALTAMEQSAHGVCQAIAVHWALKRLVPEAQRRDVYETAGRALRALCETSQATRLQHAAAEARAKAELDALAAMMPEPAAATSGAASAPPSRRPSFTANKSVLKAKKAEEKAWENERKRREKEARVLAKSRSKRLLTASATAGVATAGSTEYSPEDIMQLQAGLIPWSLFPYDQIDMLAGTEDACVGVWFTPVMADASKFKMRKMKLTVTPDLRTLAWGYYSRRHKRDMSWDVDLATIRALRIGVQLQPRRKRMFARSANPARGVCLDVDDTNTLLHTEASNPDEQDLLVRTLAVLCQYARARAGMQEPMPEVHVPLSMLLDDDAPAAAATAAVPTAAGAPPPPADDAVVGEWGAAAART